MRVAFSDLGIEYNMSRNQEKLSTVAAIHQWNHWSWGNKDDGQFRIVFDAIRQLLAEDEKPTRRI